MTESNVTYITASRPDAGAVPDDTAVATHLRASDNKEIQDIIISDGTNTAAVSSDGQLHVVMTSKKDANNSSTTPLGAGATFAGTATDTSAYSTIAVMVLSDVASAVGGLIFEYSNDGTNWFAAGESYTVLAGVTKFFTPPPWLQYYRVKYTNGATPQGTFNLQINLKKNVMKWSSHNITDPIKSEDDAELVKAVITGVRADGVYDNVNLTNGANMKVSLEEFDTALNTTPLPVVDAGMLSSSLFDEILVTYTDATKAVISKVEWKLSGAVVSTLTPTFGATTDDWVKS